MTGIKFVVCIIFCSSSLLFGAQIYQRQAQEFKKEENFNQIFQQYKKAIIAGEPVVGVNRQVVQDFQKILREAEKCIFEPKIFQQPIPSFSAHDIAFALAGYCKIYEDARFQLSVAHGCIQVEATAGIILRKKFNDLSV